MKLVIILMVLALSSCNRVPRETQIHDRETRALNLVKTLGTVTSLTCSHPKRLRGDTSSCLARIADVGLVAMQCGYSACEITSVATFSAEHQ